MKRPFGDKLNATMDFYKRELETDVEVLPTYLILPLCLIQAISMNGIMGGAMGIAAAKEAGTNYFSGHRNANCLGDVTD